MNTLPCKLRRHLPSVLSLFALALGFFVFIYSDITDTLDNAVMLAECAVKGEIGSFYRYAAENAASSTVYVANYDLPVYLIFVLWNLPTVLFHLFTGFDYTVSVPALLWCKLMLPVFLFLTLRVLKTLSGKLSGDSWEAVFLMLSSLAVFVPLMVASQYDIIELYLILLGMNAWADGKNGRFLLFFALAVPVKIFALFVFIPLLLIRFKNIVKILGMLLLCMIPSLLVTLPFASEPYYEAALQSQNADAVRLLLDSFLYISGTRVPVNPFLIAYFILCLSAYCTHAENQKEALSYAVYDSFFAYAFFCLLTPARSYWMVLFTPFLALLCAARREEGARPILIDLIFSASFALYMLADHWIYSAGDIASRLVLKNVRLPEGFVPKYGSFEALLRALNLYSFRHLLLALFGAACVFGLWYFHPRRTRALAPLKGEAWARLLRPAVCLFVCFAMIFCAYVPMEKAVLLPDEKSLSYPEAGIIETGSFSRILAFESEETLKTASFPIYAPNVSRKTRSMIRLCIYEDASLLYEREVGAASLGDRTEMTFPLGSIPVFPGKQYTFTLTGIPAERYDFGDIYPALEPGGTLALMLR